MQVGSKNFMKELNNNLNMDGFSKFYTKSILIRPYDFAFQFEAAFFAASGYGDCHDISFGQKQIRFNKCAFAAQIFNETFVDAVSRSKK